MPLEKKKKTQKNKIYSYCSWNGQQSVQTKGAKGSVCVHE